MAETRQQAIEKARDEKLPEVLGQAFPDDDDRRFAQLGPDILDNMPDILDNMEEAPDEVVIIVVGLPFLEDGADTPTGQP